MIRRLGLALALAAALAGAAIAQAVSPPQVFTATGIDAFPNSTTGLNTCSLQVSTTGSPTFTVVPQGSQDGGITYPVTLSTIGGGSISSAGNYSGSIAGATTFFRFNVATFSGSGTVTVTKTCSSQITPATQASAIAVSSLPPVVVSSQPPNVVSSLPPVQLAYSGASPVPVTTAAPAATPIPIVTASPGGYPAHQRIVYGNGVAYVDSAVDEITYTATISSVTTTQVVAGAAGKYTFLANVFVYLTATNAAYVYLEYGTGATCGTGTTNITQYVNVGTANGTATALFPPLYGPVVLPQGVNLCAVTAGSTISLIVEAFYTQHA